MSKTDGTSLAREERHELAYVAGGWQSRPCANRPDDLICETSDCTIWFRPHPDLRRVRTTNREGLEEMLYSSTDELPLDMDTALAWLKKQDRVIHITGGTPGHMWQVRVSKVGGNEEHILFSRSRNALRLEDAVLRAAYDVMKGIIP